MFGLVTWTVRISSASMWGSLSLKEVRLMEMRWKVGSLGFALRRAATAVAEAAPMNAEVQLHFTFLPMGFDGNYRRTFSHTFLRKLRNGVRERRMGKREN